jgi:cell division protein FtsB
MTMTHKTAANKIADVAKRAAASAFRQAIGPALGTCVVAYFMYYAVHGDRGVIALRHLQTEIAKAEQTLEQTRGERERLERRALLLRGDHLDRDMLDERVRAMLNLGLPNEIIIALPRARPSEDGGQ